MNTKLGGLTNADVGLGNVTNDKQATKVEFDVLDGAVDSLSETVSTHLAEDVHQGVHQKVEATSIDDATSVIDAPLKSAGGLAVAKSAYIGTGKILNPSDIHIPANTTKTIKVSAKAAAIVGKLLFGGRSGQEGFLYKIEFGGGMSTNYNTKRYKLKETIKEIGSNITIGALQVNAGGFQFTILSLEDIHMAYTVRTTGEHGKTIDLEIS